MKRIVTVQDLINEGDYIPFYDFSVKWYIIT